MMPTPPRRAISSTSRSEAAAWLEDLARRGQRPGPYTLDLIAQILDALGRPQESFPALHVAGTRGKGSTCALLSAALHHAGHSVGLSTSPHLVDVRERIRIGEQDIEVEVLLDLLGRVKRVAAGLEPSYFEVMTAVSFLAFAEAGVSVGIMEVGLGGRLDATTVCQPVVTAITRLGLEHCDRLGDTLTAIAGEKAGILKPGVPVVVGLNEQEAVRVVVSRAKELAAPCRLLLNADVAGAPATGLAGTAQAENAALAWAVLQELAVVSAGRIALRREEAEQGMLRVRWAARQQQLLGTPDAEGVSVKQLLDVAHDEVSIRALLEAVEGMSAVPVLVFSCLQGKDLPLLAGLIAGNAATAGRAVFVPDLQHPRARPSDEVVSALRALGLDARGMPDVASALLAAADRALLEARDEPGEALVVAFGSFVLVGEVLRLQDPGTSSVTGGPNP